MDHEISTEDDFVEALTQSVMREDAFALGRAAGYRGRRLASAMDHIEKWKDIAARKKSIEPYLEAMQNDLPDNIQDWTDEHKITAAQIALIRSTDKSDVMQRGLEHLAKIKGLVLTRSKSEEDESTKNRKLIEEFAKLGQDMKAQLEAKAKPNES